MNEQVREVNREVHFSEVKGFEGDMELIKGIKFISINGILYINLDCDPNYYN